MIRSIMPWKAGGPGDVTLLTARGKRLTKRFTPNGEEPYDNAALFAVDAVRLDGFDALPELAHRLAPQSSTCAIRAALKPEFAGCGEIRRRLHDRDGESGRFAEVPRSWVMIDLEPSAAPGIDPVDPILVGG
jgi:hypothetical protein